MKAELLARLVSIESAVAALRADVEALPNDIATVQITNGATFAIVLNVAGVQHMLGVGDSLSLPAGADFSADGVRDDGQAHSGSFTANSSFVIVERATDDGLGNITYQLDTAENAGS